MQVVIGGAYNGKRRFVKEVFLKNHIGKQHFFEGEIPIGGHFQKEDAVIIGSLELLILQKSHLDEEAIAEDIFNRLSKLEQQANIICICTDIGRGVVPLEREERVMRDACGRLYQKLFSKSERVIRIWYGIPEILKGEGI